MPISMTRALITSTFASALLIAGCANNPQSVDAAKSQLDSADGEKTADPSGQGGADQGAPPDDGKTDVPNNDPQPTNCEPQVYSEGGACFDSGLAKEHFACASGKTFYNVVIAQDCADGGSTQVTYDCCDAPASPDWEQVGAPDQCLSQADFDAQASAACAAKGLSVGLVKSEPCDGDLAWGVWGGVECL
jgi:hypothetical protein